MSMFDSTWLRPLADALRTLVLDDDPEYPSAPPTLPSDRPRLTPDSSALVVWASQTGAAEYLAQVTCEHLEGAGITTRSIDFESLQVPLLEAADMALFVVSTTYDGDPPDMAEAFRDEVMAQPAALSQLRYALLALGDRCYDNFCGFGRQVEEWLETSGAHACFKPIEVDDEDEQAIAWWWEQLDALLPEAAPAGPSSATAKH